MRSFAISAAAIVVVTLAVAMPARAEMNYGALTQNGQCWKEAAGPAGSSRFGYWAPCAQPASAVAPATKHRKHAASR